MTCPHNDMNFLEDLCKRNDKVAYIADGAYSMGGVADMESLRYLKDRYGLFLYMDDSHALSAVGTCGIGLVRPKIPTLDDDCLIVASLAKSFGASGGLVMLGSERQKILIQRYGGPSNWSQSLNSAAIGAGRASIQLHRTLEFAELQDRLQSNIKLFDTLVPTKQFGSNMAIRLLFCGKAEQANSVAIELADLGFFTSAVFFPVVAQDQAAIRITLRADMEPAVIHHFCELVKALIRKHGGNKVD